MSGRGSQWRSAIPPFSLPVRKRSRIFAALATVMVCIAAPFVSVGPAFAAVGMGVTADFPTNVVVGQTGIPVTYSISNVSDAMTQMTQPTSSGSTPSDWCRPAG